MPCSRAQTILASLLAHEKTSRMKLKTLAAKTICLIRLLLLVLFPASSYAVSVSVPHPPIHFHGHMGWESVISAAIPAFVVFIGLSAWLLPAKECLKFISSVLGFFALVLIYYYLI